MANKAMEKSIDLNWHHIGTAKQLPIKQDDERAIETVHHAPIYLTV